MVPKWESPRLVVGSCSTSMNSKAPYPNELRNLM